MYVSQDPIGLDGGILNLYGYVDDTNAWIDSFGLSKSGYKENKNADKGKDNEQKVRSPYPIAKRKYYPSRKLMRLQRKLEMELSPYCITIPPISLLTFILEMVIINH